MGANQQCWSYSKHRTQISQWLAYYTIVPLWPLVQVTERASIWLSKQVKKVIYIGNIDYVWSSHVLLFPSHPSYRYVQASIWHSGFWDQQPMLQSECGRLLVAMFVPLIEYFWLNWRPTAHIGPGFDSRALIKPTETFFLFFVKITRANIGYLIPNVTRK